MTDNEAIAFVMFFAAAAFVVTVLLVTQYARRRLRSQEVIRAIERGQPLPMRPRPPRSYLDELRTGVLLVCVSAGFALFLYLVDSREVTAIALVPLFIGLGFLINSALTKRYGNDPKLAETATGADQPVGGPPSDHGVPPAGE